jgi:hypothetical protein
MGTVGMATVGLVTAPGMGRIADRYAHERLPAAETTALLRDAEGAAVGARDPDLAVAGEAASGVLAALERDGALPAPETANALRAIGATTGAPALAGRARAILAPAENYGGRISFRYVVPLCGVLVLIFGALYLRDRRAGGYRTKPVGATA